MPEALALVKRELGADAVIYGTRYLNGGVGGVVARDRVEITAGRLQPTQAESATPRREAPTVATVAAPQVSAPATPIAPSAPAKTDAAQLQTPGALEAALAPYYERLVAKEVGEQLAARLVREAAAACSKTERLSPEWMRRRMQEAISALLRSNGGITLPAGQRRRVALIGPPGGGKTTTLAKIAAHFQLRERRRVGVLSLDASRLAAHEQVRKYGELIGIPVLIAQSIADASDAVGKLDSCELILIDTPGVSAADEGRFARLSAMLRVARPDETHLVLPASMTVAAQSRAASTFQKLGATGLILSRLDEAVGVGAVLNAVEHLQLSLTYLTRGQNVPRDIEEASAERLAEMLVN